jgi:hypothetical protein
MLTVPGDNDQAWYLIRCQLSIFLLQQLGKRYSELGKGILRYVADTRNHGLQPFTFIPGLERFVVSEYNPYLDDRTSRKREEGRSSIWCCIQQ